MPTRCKRTSREECHQPDTPSRPSSLNLTETAQDIIGRPGRHPGYRPGRRTRSCAEPADETRSPSAGARLSGYSWGSVRSSAIAAEALALLFSCPLARAQQRRRSSWTGTRVPAPGRGDRSGRLPPLAQDEVGSRSLERIRRALDGDRRRGGGRRRPLVARRRDRLRLALACHSAAAAAGHQTAGPLSRRLTDRQRMRRPVSLRGRTGIDRADRRARAPIGVG